MRNMLLIALPFNATEAEIEAAHAAIDLQFLDGVAPDTAAASTAPATATTEAAPTGTLDSTGLPWDERIHSSNKKMTDKGVWVARRNVADAVRASVTAEIRATLAAGGAAPAVTQTAPPATATTAPPSLGLPGATGGLPSLPGAATVDPRYTDLVSFIGRNTKSDANPTGLIEAVWLGQVLTHFGVTDGSLQTLAHNLGRIDEIATYVKKTVLAQPGAVQ